MASRRILIYALLSGLVFTPHAVSNSPEQSVSGSPRYQAGGSVPCQLPSAGCTESPKFAEAITNLTVPVGREAVLTCIVDDLGAYKVAWLRVDTQTILTIHGHVITKNHRIGVTHSDHRTWYLHIKEVREADRGWYMCQINTDPMKSQVGFLDVVVPPDILDYPTSTDMVVREGSNVSFRCAASGSPPPSITWRREAGESIPLPNGQEGTFCCNWKRWSNVLILSSVEGPVFNLTRVNRLHMGAYLCIASNGVPPSVSKRIMLIVHFPPMIWIQNQLVGAMEGEEMTLECHSEAYPKSINFWTREKGDIISHGAKYEPVLLDNAYKVHMKLTIHSVGPSDFGAYKCVSKNSLGDTDGSIKLYKIPRPSTTPPTTVTTEVLFTPPKIVIPKMEDPKEKHPIENEQESNIDMNEIAALPEARDHNIRPGSRNKIQEKRLETSMDRSRLAESKGSALAVNSATIALLVVLKVAA